AWPAIFHQALKAAPTHHHAAYMAYNLIRREAKREELIEFIRIYESETGHLLEITAANRPGYVSRPAITGASTTPEPRGELVRLSPGQRVTLPAILLRGAPKLRIGVYLEVHEGAVHVAALPDAAHAAASLRCTSVDVSSQTIEHYWRVDCDGLDD